LYLKQQNPETYWVLDIEGDGLDSTRIWCVVVRNLSTDEELVFTEKEEFNAWHSDTNRYIGHNAISFDEPILNRLWESGIDLGSVVDTLVLSYLYNPALENGHSLDAWGVRLKFPKGDFNDWSQYSDEMLKYCKNDVLLTLKLYKALSARMAGMGYSEISCEIEHRIRVVIDEQQRHGFWFDRKRAEDFCADLRSRQSDIAKQVQTLFQPNLVKVAEFTFRRTKDGSPTASYERHLQKYHSIVHNRDGSYSCYNLVPFNLGSPKQRTERLLSLGWEPQSFTPKGNPKVDEDALVLFAEASGKPEVAALAEWLVLQGRLSMVAGNPDTGSKGWLGHVGPDSRIHGRVMSCGAATRRMVHSSPNSANIPSGAKAKYGHECRSFWGVEPGKGLIQVGADASGLENVGLLHYLNNNRATELLTQKKPNDVHSLNARELTNALGFEVDREWGAKTSFFALIFGAGDEKLGSIVKKGKKEGSIIRETIIKNVPGFERLLEETDEMFFRNSGRLETVDGGFVLCPSKNAALNYRVQSLGAVVMKLACIILHDEAKKQGLDFQLLGTIHDEWQMQTKEENGDRLGQLAVECMTKASEELKFNVPLYGAYKLGYTWADCH